MEFTAEELEQVVKPRRMEAEGHVRAHGLVIGEDHDNPHGRGLIGNLIQQSIVSNLFLEAPDVAISCFVDNDGPPVENQEEPVGEWLRRKALDGVDLRTDEEWGRIKEKLQAGLFRHDIGDHGNKARMVSLIEFAVRRRVPVHFADKDLFGTNISPVTKEGMRKRDEYMVEYINKVMPDSRSGCVLLVGRSHGANNRFGSLNMGRIDVERSQALGPPKKP